MREIPLPPTAGTPKNPVPLLAQRIELLEGENRMLLRKLQAAYFKLAQVQGEDPQQVLDQLVAELQAAETARLERELKAAEAESGEAESGEAESGETETSSEASADAESSKRRGHGPRPQLRLQLIEDLHELEEPTCKICDGAMEPLGEQFEEYFEITVVERQYALRRVKKRKYRCRCNSCVVTAPGPIRLVPGGRYSLDFTVQVAIDKYLDHLPLERQVRIMERLGLDVTSQTLFDQLARFVQVLLPTYEALRRLVLLRPVLHADETGWPWLSARGSPWTAWTLCTPDIAYYSILDSKSAEAGRRLLSGYSGIVVADGYAVYEVLAREEPDLRLANCWAHARRKFKDIKENFPTPCRKVLSWIGELFAIEREVPGVFPGDADAQELRHRLREERSRPVLAKIYDWACTEVGLPRSELGKAVRYMLKRWSGLTLFLENPLVAIDNNAAERSLRGPVIGRKIHYGSKSERGIQVAAVLYSLLETAKLCGVEPASYLKAAAEQALKEPGSVLLPHDFDRRDGEPTSA